jgi:tetratricopeptide (TPR) repeat protein
MAEQTLPEDSPQAPSGSIQAGETSVGRSRLRSITVWLCMPIALTIALIGYLWWSTDDPAPEVPSVALEQVDSEVREVVSVARDKVLAEPKSALSWGRLGVVLMANGYPAEAGRCFERAANLDANDARWPYYHGLSALSTDPARALKLLRLAAKLNFDSESTRTAVNIRLSEALLERQELDEAESILEHELQISPANSHAQYDQGLLALARGQLIAGKTLFLKLVDSPFVRRKVASNLAVIERRLGNDDSADRYEKNLRDLPDDMDWMDNPFDSYRDALVVGLRSSDRAAVRLRINGKYDEAIRITVQNAQAHPRLDTFVSASITLAEAGNYDAALYYLRKTLEIDANYAEGHYLIGSIKFFLAEKQSKTDPLNEMARGNYREAIDHARRAVSIKPDYGIAYYYLGRALCSIGEKQEAVVQLRMAVKCRPELATTHLFLAEALWETGKKDEAVNCACVARDLFDRNDSRFRSDYDRISRYMNDNRLKPLDGAK